MVYFLIDIFDVDRVRSSKAKLLWDLQTDLLELYL